jgi:gas vesicle protein
MVKRVEFDLGKKKKEKKDLTKGIGIGAAIGSTVGALTGLLFAPKAGKETREKIKTDTINVAKKTAVDLKDAAVKARENTLSLIKNTCEKVECKCKDQCVKEENTSDKD